MSAEFDFSGRHVVITGGTSGIGLATAEAFQSSGADVTVTGLTVKDADQVGNGVRAVVLDVTDENQIDTVAQSMAAVDVLVNCAGTIQRAREFETSGFQQVIDVNLIGTMRLCMAFRSRLANSKGCVVNIASMLTYFGSGLAPAYSASKGGVGQLTKSLAIAWSDIGVRVNAVAPGWIETPLTQPVIQNPSSRQEIIDRTPMQRWGNTSEVADPILFLCSSAARFVTGAILPVDGGYSAC